LTSAVYVSPSRVEIFSHRDCLTVSQESRTASQQLKEVDLLSLRADKGSLSTGVFGILIFYFLRRLKMDENKGVRIRDGRAFESIPVSAETRSLAHERGPGVSGSISFYAKRHFLRARARCARR
jgi:hypothetical protein